MGAMREPETWDKREVVTPTSLIFNLKQLAETWESNKQHFDKYLVPQAF